MIKRAKELETKLLSNRFGGKGEFTATGILSMDEFQGKGRLFAHNVLPPGSSIGWHEHQGDVEAYYILKGEATVNDNGVNTIVQAGDVVFTKNGESHSIENTGDADLEFIALVLYV